MLRSFQEFKESLFRKNSNLFVYVECSNLFHYSDLAFLRSQLDLLLKYNYCGLPMCHKANLKPTYNLKRQNFKLFCILGGRFQEIIKIKLLIK